MMIRPKIEHAPRKLTPIVRKDAFWRAALCDQRVTHLDYVLPPQLLADADRQSLAAEDVDDRQRAKALPVRQLVGNEVQAPGLVRPLGDVSLSSRHEHLAAPRQLAA